jgi:diguanylate cyclase (GGDEF)-like protein
MAASRRNNTYGAVLFLDLDNFKPLNDTYGHNAGDLLLIEAAERLKQCAREMDTVARFGGDEFVMILNDLGAHITPSAALASLVAEKIRISLSAPYLLEVKQEEQPDRVIVHHCTASIGIALFINHDDKPNEVMKRADEAMYHAKLAGRNQIRLYEPKV